MKIGITSLDLFFIASELQELVGSKVQGIKDVGDSIVIELYGTKKKQLKIAPNAIYISAGKQQASKPSDFVMALRKYIKGKELSSISQYQFDRIIEINFEDFILIAELFSKGNLVLAKENGLILNVKRREKWKGRTLKPRSSYRHPPPTYNPLAKNFMDFQHDIAAHDKEIVKVLAADFGLSSLYAEELCVRFGIDKDELAKDLTQDEIDKIYRFFEQLRNGQMETQPRIMLDGDMQIDVVPFEMHIYGAEKVKEFKAFNEAVEEYFENLEDTGTTVDTRDEKEKRKIERILKEQEAQLKELQEKEKEHRTIAQILYKQYPKFVKIIAEIKQMKDQKMKWEDIEEKIKFNPDVKELVPKQALVVIEADDLEIDIDFRKDVKEIAAGHFEAAKKAKEKIEKIEKSMIEFKAKMEEKERRIAQAKAGMEDETQEDSEYKEIALPAEGPRDERPELEQTPVKEWYEKYRWFKTSGGLIVVAGKDAQSNEELIKRHMEDTDIVLHADVHGSPFGLIKKGIKARPREVKEAAQFVASYSRAWKYGQPIDVYYIDPKQVVKGPGLPAGSFLIKGERDWMNKMEMRLAIGEMTEGKVKKLMVGPVAAVEANTEKHVVIVPGDKSANEIAETVKKKLKLKYSLESIIKLIPYGRAEISE